jgi:glycosyltransferase involved in cell wall biosynthesis
MLTPETLHIGLFCDVERRSGVYSYTRALAEQLSAHRFSVELVTIAPTVETQQNLADLRLHCQRVTVLPAYIDDGSRIRQLAQVLADRNFDIFIPNYRETTYAACASGLATSDTKVIGICHNDHESYYRLLERYSDAIEAFVAPTQKVAQELCRIIPSRAEDVRAIPHGIATSTTQRADFSGGPIRLIYHGRLMEEQKATSQLVAVAAELRARGVPFHMTLLGDVADGTNYADMIAQQGLTEHIQLRPSVGPAELNEILAQHHVALLSSQYEGFCLSLAEGMGLGLVGVAMQCGGVIEEYLHDGENGFLVPWGDAAALAQRIEQLSQDQNLWRQMSRSAAESIRSGYSLAAFGQHYAQWMSEIADRETLRRWPRWRPIVVDPQQQRLEAALDFAGRTLGIWN